MALNYDAMTALTRKKHIPKLVDNIFQSNPFMSFLKSKQKTYDGGIKIVQPLIYGEIGGIQSYAGYDQLAYDTSIPVTAAEFEPRNIAAPIIISKDEELKNMGEDQVLDLLEAKVQIVEESLKKQFTSQLFGDGTGNGNKDLIGLGALFSTTNTYGGISRTDNTWWKPYINTDNNNRNLSEDLLLTTFLQVSDGEDKPDVILTGVNGFKQYYALVKGRITLYTENVKKAISLGFQTLEFMGMPIIMDRSIDDSSEVKFYFLNMKYLQLRSHKAANFTTTKWRPDDSRLAMKQEILWTGNLTCSNCRRQGLLAKIAPTGLSI